MRICAIEKDFREDINQFSRDYKAIFISFEEFVHFCRIGTNLYPDEPYFQLCLYASDDNYSNGGFANIAQAEMD